MSLNKSYKLYNQRVMKCMTSFSCPLCKKVVLPKQFEKHCTDDHAIDSRLRCVWCLGKETWPRGKKSERVDAHLLQCWRKFMVSVTRIEDPPPEPPSSDIPTMDYKTFDQTPVCEPRNLYGRSKILPERCYESVGELNVNDTVLPVHYQDSSLNLAARCVLKYLQLEDSADWFHVMIRAVAMPKFLEALDEDDGIRLLPFGCWCDGGKFEMDKYRQHRHAVVVSTPKDRFEREFWPKIKSVDDKDRPKNFCCARKKRIVSRMHLVNTIGYLSKRESRCNFTFDKKDQERLKHYYILQSLPADYRLALVTLWDGGIAELIHQEFCHMDPKKLIGVPSIKVQDGKWHVRVADIPGIELNLVLPASRPFVPGPPNSTFLHLTRGRKLYFTRSDDDEENWTEIQARGGNRFCGIVGDDYWAPSKYQQRVLDVARPLFEGDVQLEAEIVGHREIGGELFEELRSMKQGLEIAEDEIKSLLKEINLINKTVITDLRERNAKLEQEITHLRERNAKLEEENAHLRERNARLTEENVNLKDKTQTMSPQ